MEAACKKLAGTTKGNTVNYKSLSAI